MKDLNRRALELMQPIQRQIMMCDDKQELVMLSFMMMNTAQKILDEQCGEEFRKFHFNELNV